MTLFASPGAHFPLASINLFFIHAWLHFLQFFHITFKRRVQSVFSGMKEGFCRKCARFRIRICEYEKNFSLLNPTEWNSSIYGCCLVLTCFGRIFHPHCPCRSQTSHDTGPDSTPPPPVLERRGHWMIKQKKQKTPRTCSCICCSLPNFTHSQGHTNPNSKTGQFPCSCDICTGRHPVE